ncbi:hypothetical protein ACSNOJ_10120 [Streptomyces sp. URMC 128]|uniref:hypothetical protein n=1 Tax=Streptomyces sp. URMC 128 TaxID=3423404 RepID=UPI003F1DD4EC
MHIAGPTGTGGAEAAALASAVTAAWARAERMGLLVAALPGLTALVALLFTWMSVDQSRTELRIAEQGQITNRFTAAINNLGSNSEDVRLGGIYGLVGGGPF